jgi:hypothetical protein
MLTFSLPHFCSSRQRNAELGGRGAESVKPGNENHVTSRAIDIAAQVKVSMIDGHSKPLQYLISSTFVINISWTVYKLYIFLMIEIPMSKKSQVSRTVTQRMAS